MPLKLTVINLDNFDPCLPPSSVSSTGPKPRPINLRTSGCRLRDCVSLTPSDGRSARRRRPVWIGGYDRAQSRVTLTTTEQQTEFPRPARHRTD
ncbi:kelch-domain-containing protein [Anopheles sinensis]|uniref:Kelch-domain-containing protein n=1 Tax=Anopheles sinensis TaxID=74873 RepID=A0A084VKJ1_ANOSI|nr:kelch-domain-containing protein [Anopheles sinensis]